MKTTKTNETRMQLMDNTGTLQIGEQGKMEKRGFGTGMQFCRWGERC